MEKINSISENTYNLKKIAGDIIEAISKKGILERENIKDDLSLFSGYVTDTIISNFENTLRNTFSYPDTIINYIYKRFSKGGYYFFDKYQKPFLESVEGSNIKEKLEKIVIPDNQEIRDIFSSSKITINKNGKEEVFDIAYFPILNLTAFEEINDLFTDNRIIIGCPKIIYNGDTVTTLANAFKGCWNLHYITIEADKKDGPSIVPLRESAAQQHAGTEVFNGCTVLEEFKFINIIPTEITGILNGNDITSNTLDKLDLTHITSVGSLGNTYSKSDKGLTFTPNLYMPKCLNAPIMLANCLGGCGNITLGVGCIVKSATFGRNDYSKKVGIISGITTSINFSTYISYDAQCVHNWLYSVATDVRTYGHPSEYTVRTLTFHQNAINGKQATNASPAIIGYNEAFLEQDENTIVYVEDTLTESNTLSFEVYSDVLDSLNNAIQGKKTPELYDAIYNMTNKKRYYITALEGESVADVHVCDFTIVEDKDKNGKTIQKARLAEGTIFDLMAQRKWEYEY